MSDKMAGGLYRCLNENGKRAGENLAVVGFDNQEIARHFIPGLTTMSLPLKEIGNVSAKLLLQQIEGAEKGTPRNDVKQKILIPCTFIERESVHRI